MVAPNSKDSSTGSAAVIAFMTMSTLFVVVAVSAFVPQENPQTVNNNNNNYNYNTKQQRSSHLWMLPMTAPPPEPPVTSTVVAESSSLLDVSSMSTSTTLHSSTLDWLSSSSSSSFMISEVAQASPPTAAEIKLLREAFASFYGTQRDAPRALELFNQVLEAWQRQPADELAGLYRVRGDVYMANLNADSAIQDYSKAIRLLQQDAQLSEPKADPAEFQASYLGRARALRTLGVTASSAQRQMAVDDYKQALLRSAKEDADFYDSQQEQIEDGGRSNPYAIWEYGKALRLNEQFNDARDIHLFAAETFKGIGDSARSVISKIDAGIDAASSPNSKEDIAAAEELLKDGIKSTTKVEGRDVPLLQRVIAKEGEGRMALAALEWSTSGQKSDAETELTTVSSRLDQLEADALARQRVNPPPQLPPRLLFSIDDQPGALETSATKLKQTSFLNDRLEWSASLQQKVEKLLKVKA